MYFVLHYFPQILIEKRMKRGSGAGAMAMAVAAVFRPRPRLAYSGATRGHGPTYRAPGPTPTLPRALFLPLPLPDNQRSADDFNTSCLLDQITHFNVYTFLTLTIYSLITVCHGAAGRSILFVLLSLKCCLE